MITFELDVNKKTIIVHGDDTNVNTEITTRGNVNSWCIDYLRRHVYRSVNQLIIARKQEYAHVVYVKQIDDLAACEHLLQLNETIYTSTDWLTEYLTFLKTDVNRIFPSKNSRFLQGFVKKRDNLIATLECYKDCISMYYTTNVAKQTRLNFI